MLKWVQRGTCALLSLVAACGFPEPTAVHHDSGTGADGTIAPGDFQLALAHPTARVPAGSFDFIDITIARGAGTAAAVNVTIENPPAGVTVTALTIADTATTGQLRVDGDATLAIGSTLTLDVEASSGSVTHDASVAATVTGIPGAVDTTFGSDSSGATTVPLRGEFTDVAIGSGDRILLSTNASNAVAEFAEVAAMTPLGVLDPSFGSAGIEQEVVCMCAGQGFFNAVGILSTGKVVAGGNASVTSETAEAFTAGFTPTGSNDLAYNFGQGHEVYDLGSDNDAAVTAVVIQPDQSILFAAQGSAGTSLFGQDYAGGDAFGPIAIGPAATGVRAMAVDPLGTQEPIYLVGSVLESGSGGLHDIQLVAIDQTAGTLASSFGSAGVVTVGSAGTDDLGVAVAVQLDHDIVIAGTSGGTIVLYRFTSTGALDPTFGTGGRASPTLPIAASPVVAMALQSDGKIIVLGTAMIARYNSDGSVDSTFVGTSGETGGAVAIHVGEQASFASLALQSDGRIIAIGGNQDPLDPEGAHTGKGVVLRLWF